MIRKNALCHAISLTHKLEAHLVFLNMKLNKSISRYFKNRVHHYFVNKYLSTKK